MKKQKPVNTEEIDINELKMKSDIVNDLNFMGIRTVSRLIEKAKNSDLYSHFSDVWPKEYYEYIATILYIKYDIPLSSVYIPKKTAKKLDISKGLWASPYDSIEKLSLEIKIIEELKKEKIKTIIELIKKAKTGSLYKTFPNWYKATFEDIDLTLQSNCGNIHLPGVNELQPRPNDKILELWKVDDADFYRTLSNLGICTVDELIRLTVKEFHALPKTKDIYGKTYGDEIYSLAEKRMREAGLKFADERGETIDIRQKPIVVLELDEKTISRLYYNGKIKLVTQLIDKQESELRGIKGITDEMITEIITKLQANRLELVPEKVEEPQEIDIPSSQQYAEMLNQALAAIAKLQADVTALQQENGELKENIRKIYERLDIGDNHARKNK